MRVASEVVTDLTAIMNPKIDISGDVTGLLPDSDSKFGSQLRKQSECMFFNRFYDGGRLEVGLWL